MKKLHTSLAAIAVTFAAAAVQAEGFDQGPSNEHRMERKERDPISRDDMMRRAAARFDKMDRDGDGVLSRREMAGARKHQKGEKGDRGERSSFGRMDANNDGNVSAQEFRAAAAKMSERSGRDVDPDRLKKRFHKMDADGSGDLSVHELKKQKAKHKAKDAWQERKGGDGAEGHEGKGQWKKHKVKKKAKHEAKQQWKERKGHDGEAKGHKTGEDWKKHKVKNKAKHEAKSHVKHKAKNEATHKAKNQWKKHKGGDRSDN